MLISAIVPPPPLKNPAIFIDEHFSGARDEEGRYEKKNLQCVSFFYFAKEGLSNDDVEVAKGVPCFRRNGRELVSKPAISPKKSSGGATVVRLESRRKKKKGKPPKK